MEHYLRRELYARAQESPEIFEFIESGSLDGIWYWDLIEPENEWMSPRFWETLGFDPSQKRHIAEEWKDLIHSEDLQVALKNFKKHCIDPTHPYDQIVRYKHRDGSTVWVRCRGMAIRDEKGKPIRMLGAHTDVTALMNAHEYTKSILDTIHEPLIVVDRRLCVHLVNRAYCEYFGSSKEETIGEYLYRLCGGIWDDEKLRKLIDSALNEHERIVDFELDRHVPQLGRRILNLNGRHVAHSGTSSDLILLAVNDITERQLARERLQASYLQLKKHHEAAVLASGQLFYTWNPETNAISYANTHALDYAPTELLGGFERWLELIHEDDRNKYIKEKRRSTEQKGPFSLDYRLQKNDGSYIPVEDHGYFTFDETGSVRWMVGFVTNVSDKKSLENQLRQAQKMEALGRLAGGVAHDFNNQLTVMIGYSEFMIDSFSETDPKYAQLSQILDAGNRAAALTRQLLAFSRKQVLQPKTLDPNVIVAQLDTMLRRLIGEDIEIRLRLNSRAAIKFDPGQLEQVIMNLVLNARDAMPSGGTLTIETKDIEIDETYVDAKHGAKSGPHVMLAISDTGIGIREETRARIFEPFFTTKSLGRGTGLGLSTVFGIVKQSGGNIWVYSEIDKGTTFKVYIPQTCDEIKPVRDVIRRSIEPSSKVVLVVEDDPGVRSIVVAILREFFTVLKSADAESGIEICKQFDGEIHLLLTDVVMPGMGGRELAEAVRHSRPNMHVMYMSGYTDTAIIHHGVLEADVAFIDKPIRARELVERAMELINREIRGK